MLENLCRWFRKFNNTEDITMKKHIIIFFALILLLLFSINSQTFTEQTKNIISTTYTRNTETTCYKDGKCVLKHYGDSSIFIDETGTKADTVKSLKNAKWKPFNLKINKSSILDADIQILDYNYTWARLNITFHNSGLIPIRKITKDTNIETNRNYFNVNKNQVGKPHIVEIRLNPDLSYHIGETSTSIEVNYSITSTQYGCTQTRVESPTDEGGRGGMILAYSSFGISYGNIYCKYNITGYVPTGNYIESAIFYAESNTESMDAGESMTVNLKHIFNNFTIDGTEWLEGNGLSSTPAVGEINVLEQPTSSYIYSTILDTKTLNDGVTQFQNWTMTRAFSHEYNNSNNDLSFLLNWTSSTLDVNNDDGVSFNTDNDAQLGDRPYILVTYRPKTMTPTPTSLTNTSNGQTNITLSWNGNYGSNYLIYQNGTNVVNTTSSPYTRTGLTNNTRYSFKVKAYNLTYDTTLSNFSNTIEVRTKQTASSITSTCAYDGSGNYVIDNELCTLSNNTNIGAGNYLIIKGTSCSLTVPTGKVLTIGGRNLSQNCYFNISGTGQVKWI